MTHWNEICLPEELVEIDERFRDEALAHIEVSLNFIRELTESKVTPGSIRSFSTRCAGEMPSRQKVELLGEGVDFGKLKLFASAPEFELFDSDGRLHSLPNAKPTLVVFFRGDGCLHCAMQLKELARRAGEFENAGISILAVSCDSRETLKKSIVSYDGRIPFPIVSDEMQRVFGQYGLVAGETSEPLHASFLVDQKGQVLWHDVGEQPFMDGMYLLNECIRLLGNVSEIKADH